jgi:hypothetical protein
MNNDGKLATNRNKHRFTKHVNKRLSRDRLICARVKYLYEYRTDNCNCVCPVVMLLVSLPFGSLTSGLLKKHRTPQQLCCFIPNTPVQYQIP